MPIYEYHCLACGERFEKLVFGSAPKVACPGCASAEVARDLSLFGVKSGGVPMAPMAAPGGSGGGGCCGGGCGCR